MIEEFKAIRFMDFQRTNNSKQVSFSSTGRYSKWGSWGLMEYHGQPTAQAPKYNATIQFLNKNPRWW